MLKILWLHNYVIEFSDKKSLCWYMDKNLVSIHPEKKGGAKYFTFSFVIFYFWKVTYWLTWYLETLGQAGWILGSELGGNTLNVVARKHDEMNKSKTRSFNELSPVGIHGAYDRVRNIFCANSQMLSERKCSLFTLELNLFAL